MAMDPNMDSPTVPLAAALCVAVAAGVLGPVGDVEGDASAVPVELGVTDAVTV